MIRRHRLFAIGSTDIFLHPAAVLFALYVALTGHGGWLLAGMLSVLLHECAHGFAAALLGCTPTSIEITPLGALMRLEDEAALPPGRRLAMLLAGPAASLLLCWTALLLTRCGIIGRHAGQLLFMTNLSILLVNLLPALPLDGGRVLALLLSLCLSADSVRRAMRSLGMIFGCACIALNLLLTWKMGGWNLSLACAGCFLMYAACTGTTTAALAELRAFMDRKLRLEQRGCMGCRVVAVTESLTLRGAVGALAPSLYTLFLLIQPGTMRCLGYVTEERVISCYLLTPGGTCAALKHCASHGQNEARYAD